MMPTEKTTLYCPRTAPSHKQHVYAAFCGIPFRGISGDPCPACFDLIETARREALREKSARELKKNNLEFDFS